MRFLRNKEENVDRNCNQLLLLLQLLSPAAGAGFSWKKQTRQLRKTASFFNLKHKDDDNERIFIQYPDPQQG